MVPLQNTKFVSVIDPVGIVDNASWTTNEIDTKGYDYATIIFQYGTSDIALAALKVQECDTSGGSFSDITGLVEGTSDNIDGSTSALQSATDDDCVVVFEIDLRNRNRYLDLVATAGDGSNGTFASAVCILSRAKDAPVSISERGCDEIMRV